MSDTDSTSGYNDSEEIPFEEGLATETAPQSAPSAPLPDDASQYILNSSWHLWYHHVKNRWTIDGYRKIFTIKTIADFWNFHNHLDKVGGINSKHFFLMRDGVEPTWEHQRNRQGGCWSLKVPNERTEEIWTTLAMYMVGETLIDKPLNINGLSVCMKSVNHSVIKIWNANSKENSIELLPQDVRDKFENILYKAHIPED